MKRSSTEKIKAVWMTKDHGDESPAATVNGDALQANYWSTDRRATGLGLLDCSEWREARL